MTAKTTLPGKFGIFGIRETIDLVLDSGRFSAKRHQKYGHVFKTRIFGQPTIFVSGAEACRFILDNENRYFQNKLLPNIERLLGQSALSVQTGEQHQHRRKLLRKAFTAQYLAGQIETIEAITEDYLQRWEKCGRFAWYPEFRNYTFDLACKLFLGLDRASETKLGNLFKIWSQGLFSFSPPLPGTKLSRALRSRREILALIRTIVENRQQQEHFGTDVLSLLLQARDEAGNPLTLEEIQDQILTLLFAGHETLASALTSLCLLLAKHPEIRECCRQEQQQFSSSDSLISEQLEQMLYLEQVIKEVLRAIPPVAGGFRQVIEECQFNGYRFPQGWSVIYQISLTHQDSQLFSCSEKFMPERFNSTNQTNPDHEGYIPFGGGKRQCLGARLANLEMKILAAMLIRGYDWELLPEQNLEIEQIPTPHPRDGLKVDFWRF